MSVKTSGTDEVRLPIIAAVALRFAEACRLIAAIALLMISVGALQWMVGHASYVIQQEMIGLQQLKNLGASDLVTSQLNPPAPETSIGQFRLTGVDVSIIAGVASVSVNPVVWVIFCIIASIAVIVLVVHTWQYVVSLWVSAQACVWKDFWSILGCLWQWIWVLITTVLTVVITLIGIIFLFYNIAALIASL